MTCGMADTHFLERVTISGAKRSGLHQDGFRNASGRLFMLRRGKERRKVDQAERTEELIKKDNT